MKKIALLSLFVMCLTMGLSSPIQAQQTDSLEFDHIFDGTFTPESIHNVNWMRDGKYYTVIERTERDLQLRRYDITTGEHQVLVNSSELKIEGRKRPIIIEDYQFSADETKLLIKTDVEKIWRRSTRENYFYYDLETGNLQKLTAMQQKQQHGRLSPNGDKAAFVSDNNLYWVDFASGKETQITSDGEKGKVINGATDWVYEEEFGFAKAWYWSPDGRKIAFYRFDESEVKEFFMTDWGDLYPDLTRFKYPKAGERNSTVKIGVYDLDSGETTWMDLGGEGDRYIPRINWTQSSDMLAIRRMNRKQNRQDLMLADSETGRTEIIIRESADTWIDVNDDLTFLEDGEHFLYVSEQSGYNHIYLYSMQGERLNQITRGNWEVTDFLGVDEERQKIYYESTEVSPLERHMYSINLDGSGKKRMTGNRAWYSVNMSPDFRYYIQHASGPSTPPAITLHRGTGAQVRVLRDNRELDRLWDQFKMPDKDYLEIELSQATLNAYLMKPDDFDPSKSYPVLIYVYGGPGSQTVTKEFSTGHRELWHRYLASKGYLVFSVDNRGTGARGREFEKQVYRKLGQYEVTDQIDAANYLVEKYSFVDPERIGIWGWSYGGYMSTLLMEQGNDLYTTGISVAPVTDWRFYDTIYTERFMQTPQENPEGYRKGSALYDAGRIRGDYLLVHGTGDDNVHFQNSVALVNRLIAEGVQFETLYYPNRSHSIYSGNSRRHLFRKMTDFIFENL